ncbi:MAG: hypothetical protein ACM3PE_08845 [Deltaproteobacteria bacterium]
MTIFAVVKTNTDLILASDSKVSTMGIGGLDENGKLIYFNQAYDYATKICFSPKNVWTVGVIGQSSIGNLGISDIIHNLLPSDTLVFSNRAEQDEKLNKLISFIADIRHSYYYDKLSLAPQYWSSTKLLVFSSDPEDRGVRGWQISFVEDRFDQTDILPVPGVWIEGSSKHAFSLLYGYSFDVIDEISATLDCEKETIYETVNNKLIKPINMINFGPMPLQDAIEFATFLVEAQIQMERFVPGNPVCGGPVDIAIMHGLPTNSVTWFPGKQIHHPRT